MNERIARLRERIEQPLLVTTPKNVQYLVGFASSNAALLVEEEHVRLYTDFRYFDAAGAVEGVEPVQHAPRADRRTGRGADGTIGFEAATLSYAAVETLRQGGLDLVPTTGVVEAIRAVKDSSGARDPPARLQAHRPGLRAARRRDRVRRPHRAGRCLGPATRSFTRRRTRTSLSLHRRRRPHRVAPARGAHRPPDRGGRARGRRRRLRRRRLRVRLHADGRDRLARRRGDRGLRRGAGRPAGRARGHPCRRIGRRGGRPRARGDRGEPVRRQRSGTGSGTASGSTCTRSPVSPPSRPTCWSRGTSSPSSRVCISRVASASASRTTSSSRRRGSRT